MLNLPNTTQVYEGFAWIETPALSYQVGDVLRIEGTGINFHLYAQMMYLEGLTVVKSINKQPLTMQSIDKKIQKNIWKYRVNKLVIFLVIFSFCISVIAFFLAINLESGEWQEVRANVESIGVNQGANGSSPYIVCRLPNGHRVNVFIDSNQLISPGDKVALRESEKLISFFGKNYTFIKKLE